MRRSLSVVALVIAAVAVPSPAHAAGAPSSGGVTAADFNGDGRSDLAIGAKGETLAGESDAGVVHVIYGSGRGLRSRGSQLWHQQKRGVKDAPEQFDLFGHALAGGDFDNDGFDDLAVGVINEDVGATEHSGAVHVFYGSRKGLSARGDELWSLGTPGVMGGPEDNAYFGHTLAAGNFGDGAATDLAIGIPGMPTYGPNSGAVLVLRGSRDGLVPRGELLVDEETAGIGGDGDSHDNFGFSLTAGDLGQSGKDDLAVGVPGDDVGGFNTAGSVYVLWGTARGISTENAELWNKLSGNIPDLLAPNNNDNFAWSLTTGNFGNGVRQDLAVGIPGENSSAGGLIVLSGGGDGLVGANPAFFSEDTEDSPGTAVSMEAYGSSLAAANFGKGRQSDIVVSVPYNEVNGVDSAGIVHVIYGSRDGLVRSSDEIWHPAKPGVKGAPDATEQFGTSLVGADFGKGTKADLVSSAPFDEVGAAGAAGSANCLYGSANGIRADGDQVWHQNRRGIAEEAEAFDLFGGGKVLVFG